MLSTVSISDPLAKAIWLNRMRGEKTKKMDQEATRKSNYFQFFAGWGAHLFFQTLDKRSRRRSRLWACGRGDYGQLSLAISLLSLGHNRNVLSPVEVAFFFSRKREIVEISVGYFHSLFLTVSGAFSCGMNRLGQLSDSTKEDRFLAVPVVLEDKSAVITSVVAGLFSSYYLTTEGFVFGAGKNNFGELGLGRCRGEVSVGAKIEGLSRIVQIVTGHQWAIFRTWSNELFGCGQEFGQFGRGRLYDIVRFPVKLTWFKENGIEINHVVSSAETAFFLTSDSNQEVYFSGQHMPEFRGIPLPFNGRTGHIGVPMLDRHLSGFQVLCSGNSNHFVVAKKDDILFGKGYDNDRFGNLFRPIGGIDEEEDSAEVSQIMKNVKQIVTRKYGTYIICGDGSIFSTGAGGEGQMMNSGKEDSSRFVFVGKYRLMKRSAILDYYDVDRMERVQFLSSRCSILRTISILYMRDYS